MSLNHCSHTHWVSWISTFGFMWPRRLIIMNSLLAPQPPRDTDWFMLSQFNENRCFSDLEKTISNCGANLNIDILQSRLNLLSVTVLHFWEAQLQGWENKGGKAAGLNGQHICLRPEESGCNASVWFATLMDCTYFKMLPATDANRLSECSSGECCQRVGGGSQGGLVTQSICCMPHDYTTNVHVSIYIYRSALLVTPSQLLCEQGSVIR